MKGNRSLVNTKTRNLELEISFQDWRKNSRWFQKNGLNTIQYLQRSIWIFNTEDQQYHLHPKEYNTIHRQSQQRDLMEQSL